MRSRLVPWMWFLPMAAIVALAIILRLDGGAVPVKAQGDNEMAIDADPADPDIDATTARAVGSSFDVSTNIAVVGTPYQGYRMSIEFDDGILSFVPVSSLNIEYTGLDDMVLDIPASVEDCDADTSPEVHGASSRRSGTTTATGQANLVRFECVGSGTSYLHLVTPGECPSSDSTTITEGGVELPTSLVDAEIVCEDGPPTPTPLPDVGGIAELPPLDQPSTAEGSPPSEGTGLSAGDLTALGSGLMAALFIAVAGGWYARRRWLR
jgi:hypothetical protein